MFSDLDREDAVKLARIIGIIFFIISFFLPAVASGTAHSPTGYHGWECALLTLFGAAQLFVPNPSSGWPDFFYLVSGWISPLVTVFAIFPSRNTAKRIVATALPFLLVAPLLFFASSTTKSDWGPDPFRPLVGHYLWTVGCLLIFTPQYARMSLSRGSDEN